MTKGKPVVFFVALLIPEEEKMRKRVDQCFFCAVLGMLVVYPAFSGEGTPPSPVGKVIAVVNGEAITVEEFDESFKSLAERFPKAYQTSKDLLLDMLVARKALIQKASSLGYGKSKDYADALKEGDKRRAEVVLISSMLRTEVHNKVKVTDQEVKKFFDDNRPRLRPGLKFENIKESLRQMLLKKKANEATTKFIEEVRDSAKVQFNQEWIAKQKSIGENNPLDKALKLKKPVLAEMVTKTCPICRKLAPTMEALRAELEGVVDIVAVDIEDYPRIALQYGIDATPTLILFDKDAKQLWAAKGVVRKEQVLSALKERGVLRGEKK